MRCDNRNTKNSIMKFRCTQEQEKIIKGKADKAKISTSEYLLKSALNSRTRISGVSKDMTRTITQCQKNLNMLLVEAQHGAENGDLDSKKLMDRVNGVQEGMDEIWRLLK